MSVEERERQRRVDQLVRDNNKRFREQKEQQYKQKAYEYFSAEEEKERMKEFAKKIQQENLRRTVLAKQAKKVHPQSSQRKDEAEKKKRKRREQQKKQAVLKMEMVKSTQVGIRYADAEQSRVTLTPEELLEADRRISQKAQEEMRRIKEAKRQAKAEQSKKQAKLQQLDIRRKNILDRTRKLPQGTAEGFQKENAGASNNIDEEKQLLRNIEQQTLKEIEMLNSLIEKASKSKPKTTMPLEHSIIPQHTEEDCSEDDEDEDQAEQDEQPHEATEEEDSGSEQDEYAQPALPVPVKVAELPHHLHHDMSFRQMMETSFPQQQIYDLSSQEETDIFSSSASDDIFKLSSAELMSRPHLRI